MRKFIIFIILLASTTFAQNFSEPECLKPSIDFWEKVYTTYDSDDAIFHNSLTFEIYIVKKLTSDPKERKELIRSTMDSLEEEYPDAPIRMQSGIKTRFSEGIVRQRKYEDMILKQIRKQKLPEELLYLPHVESSFNPGARSKVGATGMWQIMPSTGRLYGNRSRKGLEDPAKSTKIALMLLKDNYFETGSWEIALIAYNHGVDGMKRAIKELNTRDVCIIINQYKGDKFKFASKNFISQFLAVKRIMDCHD